MQKKVAKPKVDKTKKMKQALKSAANALALARALFTAKLAEVSQATLDMIQEAEHDCRAVN